MWSYKKYFYGISFQSKGIPSLALSGIKSRAHLQPRQPALILPSPKIPWMSIWVIYYCRVHLQSFISYLWFIFMAYLSPGDPSLSTMKSKFACSPHDHIWYCHLLKFPECQSGLILLQRKLIKFQNVFYPSFFKLFGWFSTSLDKYVGFHFFGFRLVYDMKYAKSFLPEKN